MNNDNNNHEEPISTLNLAAYLICAGFQLLGLRFNGRQALFIFPKTDELQTHMNNYASGTASVDLPKYEFVRNHLLDKIKGGKS